MPKVLFQEIPKAVVEAEHSLGQPMTSQGVDLLKFTAKAPQDPDGL